MNLKKVFAESRRSTEAGFSFHFDEPSINLSESTSLTKTDAKPTESNKKKKKKKKTHAVDSSSQATESNGPLEENLSTTDIIKPQLDETKSSVGCGDIGNESTQKEKTNAAKRSKKKKPKKRSTVAAVAGVSSVQVQEKEEDDDDDMSYLMQMIALKAKEEEDMEAERAKQNNEHTLKKNVSSTPNYFAVSVKQGPSFMSHKDVELSEAERAKRKFGQGRSLVAIGPPKRRDPKWLQGNSRVDEEATTAIRNSDSGSSTSLFSSEAYALAPSFELNGGQAESVVTSYSSPFSFGFRVDLGRVTK